jgi:hypothetical protein
LTVQLDRGLDERFGDLTYPRSQELNQLKALRKAEASAKETRCQMLKLIFEQVTKKEFYDSRWGAYYEKTPEMKQAERRPLQEELDQRESILEMTKKQLQYWQTKLKSLSSKHSERVGGSCMVIGEES